MKDLKISDHVKSRLENTLAYARNSRQCDKVEDLDYLYAGVSRVIGEHKSGRAFLQSLLYDDRQEEIARATYFGSLHSTRRRDLASECETIMRRHIEAEMKGMGRDHLAKFVELHSYDIYAYDGHFHAHACHATGCGFPSVTSMFQHSF